MVACILNDTSFTIHCLFIPGSRGQLKKFPIAATRCASYTMKLIGNFVLENFSRLACRTVIFQFTSQWQYSIFLNDNYIYPDYQTSGMG